MITIRQLCEDLRTLVEQDERKIEAMLKKADKDSFDNLMGMLQGLRTQVGRVGQREDNPLLKEAEGVLQTIITALRAAIRSGSVKNPKRIALDLKSVGLLLREGGQKRFADQLKKALESRARATR